MTGFRMLIANHLHKRERLIQGIDMAGVADEFRFLLDERIMRGLISGIEYGLHVFQPT